MNTTDLTRLIKVTFLPCTNTQKARIKITEDKKHIDDKKQSITFEYQFQHGDAKEQALKLLISKGFKVINRASAGKHYYFICEYNNTKLK